MKNTFIIIMRRILVSLLFAFLCMPIFSEQKYYAYLFAYFKGEGLAQGEQIYFAISQDGLHWTDLNEGNPVLTSTLGEKGLRDPFIMRSADGSKFYVIATDLKIYGNGNWTAAQTTGSKSIMVWESNDLIHWSDQRMCQVAPQGAGCTWAPEAIYNEETGEYIVFWSSKIPSSQNVANNDNTHRVYYCTTKDFVRFSDTKVWMELKNQSGRTISVIDATAIKVGDTYYRFKKNEATEAHKSGMPSSGKYIIMEKSNSLLGQWTEISSDMSQISGVEGPTCFKMNNEDKWCLFLDDFGGKGYYPLITSDLSSGKFTQLSSSQYSLPSVMRHGSVINLTESEYYGLLAQYDPSRMTTACINPAQRQQTLEGWGVSLCWWANMCGKWNDSKLDEIIQLLTSEDGLNYNIFRYNIGGGDDPSHYNGHMCNGKGKRAEMEGFKAGENTGYDWTKDAGQRKVLQKIKAARPDAIFEAFSNSAPYWMTYSGCSAGNSDAGKDNLKPAYYSQFCDYLIAVCKHFKDEYGVEFKTLDPFNEPNTNYWGANGGQEGCHFDPSSQVSLIRVLYPKLKQSGLKTVISACDETSVSTAIDELKLYIKEGDIVPMLGQFNVHTYGGNVMDKSNLRDLIFETKLPFWMSETGAGGTGIAGNLSLAQRMFDDMNYLLPQAWVDWQYVEEGNDQWCLIKGDFSRQTYSIVKNLYVRMQVTRFIKQGYTLLSTGKSDLLAAISPDGTELVVVMLNTNTSDKLINLDLSMLKNLSSTASLYVTNSKYDCKKMSDIEIENHQLNYRMGAQEISTVIIKMDKSDGVELFKEDVPYMMVPRSATSVVKAVGDGLKLSLFSAEDTLQRWYFHPLNNGNYCIYTKHNGQKLAITDDGTYYLKLSSYNESSAQQQFKIEALDDCCFKVISASNGKLFDLEGVNTASGTSVGVWEAGATGENAHREWRVLAFPYTYKATGEESDVTEQSADAMPYVFGERNNIKIYNLAENSMDICVYDVNGVCVHRMAKEKRSILSLPCKQGVYVVRLLVNGQEKTNKVIVK